MPQFADINFRYADAKTESQYAPEIIQYAFVDVEGISRQVMRPDRFIVSGQKGAGKTALAYRMQFLAQTGTDFHVAIDDLKDFQFNLLHYVDPAPDRHTENTSAAWKCVLLMRIIALLTDDLRYANDNPSIAAIRQRLAEAGYLVDEPLAGVAERVRKPDAYERIAALFTGGAAPAAHVPSSPIDLIALLQEHFRRLPKAPGWYLLFIDGLDDPMRFYENVRARRYMADLLDAVKAVNAFLHSVQPKAKVILLAREEILQDLPDPNLTKTLVDFGLPLRWYETGERFQTSGLIGVIARRAELAGFTLKAGDIESTWFPATSDERRPLFWIARHTRFLPRDIIRFFAQLQSLGKEPPFDVHDLRRAARSYSDWFYEEMHDAIKGLVREDVRLSLKEMLRALRRQFYVDELAKELEKRHLGDQRTATGVARSLFHTGWISQVSSRLGERMRSESSYLNRRATFDQTRKCAVHTGLLAHLDLPY